MRPVIPFLEALNLGTYGYLPDDHQHLLPAYQLENAIDLHPAKLIVTPLDFVNK